MVSKVQQGKFVFVDVGQEDLDSGWVVHRAELDNVFAYTSRLLGGVQWTTTDFVRAVFTEKPLS